MKTFTHQHYLDLAWKPGPGERYADAPKATMRVFRATARTVWYGYADAVRSGWFEDRAAFERDYPGVL